MYKIHPKLVHLSVLDYMQRNIYHLKKETKAIAKAETTHFYPHLKFLFMYIVKKFINSFDVSLPAYFIS